MPPAIWQSIHGIILSLLAGRVIEPIRHRINSMDDLISK